MAILKTVTFLIVLYLVCLLGLNTGVEKAQKESKTNNTITVTETPVPKLNINPLNKETL